MNLEMKLSVIFLMSIILCGCVSTSLKAPCDQYAHFCGPKTKINMIKE